MNNILNDFNGIYKELQNISWYYMQNHGFVIKSNVCWFYCYKVSLYKTSLLSEKEFNFGVSLFNKLVSYRACFPCCARCCFWWRAPTVPLRAGSRPPQHHHHRYYPPYWARAESDARPSGEPDLKTSNGAGKGRNKRTDTHPGPRARPGVRGSPGSRAGPGARMRMMVVMKGGWSSGPWGSCPTDWARTWAARCPRP